jgi:hypothetical protein
MAVSAKAQKVARITKYLAKARANVVRYTAALKKLSASK